MLVKSLYTNLWEKFLRELHFLNDSHIWEGSNFDLEDVFNTKLKALG